MSTDFELATEMVAPLTAATP